MTEASDAARAFAGDLSGTAAWLNRLERLFVDIQKHAMLLHESVDDGDCGFASTDELIKAVRAFECELFGDDDGTDHPDAVAVSSEPLHPQSLLDAVRVVCAMVQRIAAAGGSLQVSGVQDSDARAFADALYALQAAAQNLNTPTQVSSDAEG